MHERLDRRLPEGILPFRHKKMETTHACSGASEDLWSYPKKANVISKFILILGMYNFKARRMLSESIGC